MEAAWGIFVNAKRDELLAEVPRVPEIELDIADKDTPGSEWHRDRARRALARK